MKHSKITRWLAAAVWAGASFSSTAALAFSSLTVFGDSLSDSGNNALVIGVNAGQVITGNTYIPSQPYALGTYSNAQVWVNSFAAGLGLAGGAVPSLAAGGNHAFGGARTVLDGSFGGFPPSASTQLTGFLGGQAGSLAPDALFVIAIGGNDVRAAGAAVSANPGNALAIISAAAGAYATGVGNMVDALQARGAGQIVVWGVPDVGRSPAALAAGAVNAGTATFISDSFNQALALRLLGEGGVTPFNVAAAVNQVVANPGLYGLSNVTDACGAVLGCNPSQYLFWDGIHPTSAGHQILANAMLVAVVPEPAAAALMLLGLLGLAAAARRRATRLPAPVR